MILMKMTDNIPHTGDTLNIDTTKDGLWKGAGMMKGSEAVPEITVETILGEMKDLRKRMTF